MRNLIYMLLFVVFAQHATAQQGNRFDFQVQRIDDSNYKIQMQLMNPENLTTIKIHVLVDDNKVNSLLSTFNKKKDGKYYVFFNEEEKEVAVDDIRFTFSHNPDGFQYPEIKNPIIHVELFDANSILLDTIKKTID